MPTRLIRSNTSLLLLLLLHFCYYSVVWTYTYAVIKFYFATLYFPLSTIKSNEERINKMLFQIFCSPMNVYGVCVLIACLWLIFLNLRKYSKYLCNKLRKLKNYDYFSGQFDMENNYVGEIFIEFKWIIRWILRLIVLI